VTTYTVNMSALQQIAAEMGTIANQIQSMIDELDSSTSQTLSEWVSAARDVYNQARAQWDAAAAQMGVQATNAMNSLNAISDNYSAAEAAGINLWS
jgi:WXG100 family type VII secretion target